MIRDLRRFYPRFAPSRSDLFQFTILFSGLDGVKSNQRRELIRASNKSASQSLTTRPSWFNNYPTWTCDTDVADNQELLLLEHADGSVVTVLHQRGDYNGLQDQRADGSWLTVPIVPGALQVFTGYLLTKDYLDVFGRPDQVSAWQEARPYVAAVVDA
jgi:hypothetical protein